MAERRSETAKATRVRRARRDDITTLVECAGGPAAGRVRAVRRLLKTLAADVYVLEREGEVCGLVAIHYRRSLALGGLLATIDAILSLRTDETAARDDLARLTECALHRAERRGCVGIDSSVADEGARQMLRDNGFQAGPEQLGRSLRSKENEG